MGRVKATRLPAIWRSGARRRRTAGHAAAAVVSALALVGAQSPAYGATDARAGITPPGSSLVHPGGSSSFGGFPSGFWGKTGKIPKARHAIEFNFINHTKHPSTKVFWQVNNGPKTSIAQSQYHRMPSCGSCRINFYVGSRNSRFQDFIEFHTSGTAVSINTTRVDRFGLPLVVHVHNTSTSNPVAGDDYHVFSVSRPSLFRQFGNSVPAPFKQLATADGLRSIPAPYNDAAFQPGGADAGYMVRYAKSVGATETTQEVFACAPGGTPDLSTTQHQVLCAGLNRCVAQLGARAQQKPGNYYRRPPCNYYARFWHSVAVNHRQYGFPHDDVYNQSSLITSSDAKYVQVAIGW